ncbi:hypothetical protein BKA70DRAFT_1243104 [Coprinopsis sp. MPI-PUGE-AT-0042]|nr:hypothetical protein BKA70DRAFT_1243104 [Coprinopsis sp. MPI-PUGE-AT-0042]
MDIDLSVNGPPGAEQLWAAGRYATQLMKSKIDPRFHPWRPDMKAVPLNLQIELEQVADGCYRAFRNRKRLDWTVDDYVKRAGRRQAHQGDVREEDLLKTFPGLPKADDGSLYLQDEALIITDSKNRILLWYLPLIISPQRQEEILFCIEWLSQVSGTDIFTTDDKGNFRTNSGKFSSEPSIITRGVATFASAWHMQGRRVSLFIYLMSRTCLLALPPPYVNPSIEQWSSSPDSGKAS